MFVSAFSYIRGKFNSACYVRKQTHDDSNVHFLKPGNQPMRSICFQAVKVWSLQINPCIKCCSTIYSITFKTFQRTTLFIMPSSIYEIPCTHCEKYFKTSVSFKKHWHLKHPRDKFPRKLLFSKDRTHASSEAVLPCPQRLKSSQQHQLYANWLDTVVERINNAHHPSSKGICLNFYSCYIMYDLDQ